MEVRQIRDKIESLLDDLFSEIEALTDARDELVEQLKNTEDDKGELEGRVQELEEELAEVKKAQTEGNSP